MLILEFGFRHQHLLAWEYQEDYQLMEEQIILMVGGHLITMFQTLGLEVEHGTEISLYQQVQQILEVNLKFVILEQLTIAPRKDQILLLVQSLALYLLL